jgi:hypothetical protein
LLAVCAAIGFERDGATSERCLGVGNVEPVLPEIGLTLGLIPGTY